jgi:ABC-type sulfate transport system substrate-binding protein
MNIVRKILRGVSIVGIVGVMSIVTIDHIEAGGPANVGEIVNLIEARDKFFAFVKSIQALVDTGEWYPEDIRAAIRKGEDALDFYKMAKMYVYPGNSDEYKDYIDETILSISEVLKSLPQTANVNDRPNYVERLQESVLRRNQTNREIAIQKTNDLIRVERRLLSRLRVSAGLRPLGQ